MIVELDGPRTTPATPKSSFRTQLKARFTKRTPRPIEPKPIITIGP